MINSVKKEIKKINTYKKSQTNKFNPKKLLIEITNSCNSKCIFCANKDMTRKRKNIDSNIVEKALIQAKQMGVKMVGFYVTGEPLLNNKLKDYILMAKQLNYEYIFLTTNGILATPDTVKNLFQAGLDSIKFSINSINRDNYIKIHRVDKFNEVVSNLKYTYKIKNEEYKDKKVYVSYVKTIINRFDDKIIYDFFKEYCDDIIIQPVRNQGGLINNINEIKYCDTVTKLPCYYPFNTIIITCEGFVSACCMDFQNYLVYGDLNKQKLNDIWDGKIIRRLREMHIKGNVNNIVCDNCIKNVYKKCHSLSGRFCTELEFKY